MIKQLFRQIWSQRNVNLWIWMELLIVFICLSYVVDYLCRAAQTYSTPLGYNTEHVYKVKLAMVSPNSEAYDATQTDSLCTENLLTALARMRAYPGVECVSASSGAHPYNTSSSNGSRGIDTTWVHGYMYTVSPEFFRVFRIADEQGRIDPLVTGAQTEKAVILSAETVRKLTEGGCTVNIGTGVMNYMDTIPSYFVAGVCAPTRYHDFHDVYPAYYTCRSELRLLKQNAVNAEFCLRVRPDADTEAFASQFRKQMKTQLRLGNIYLLEVTSFDDLRTNYFRANGVINDIKTHVAGFSFLMLNILLGIIGTFWIRTQQRRAEVGVRIAMGSTRTGIRWWLMGEGLILLLLAALPALLIDWNVAYTLMEDFTENDQFQWQRFFTGQLITWVLMACMILLGVYIPARQAVKIHPADALHEEG